MALLKFNNSFYLDRKQEWLDNMKKLIHIIKSTPTGNRLMEEIARCNREGCKITIQEKSQYSSSYRYPKITYYGGKTDICVIIPLVPYRSRVSVINKNLLQDIEFEKNICLDYLEKISRNEEISISTIDNVDFKNNFSRCKEDFCSLEYQEPHIILAHELIHALRYAKDLHAKNYEEEATIFGVKGKTLFIDGMKITENQIRKELGMTMRVDHNGIVDR